MVGGNAPSTACLRLAGKLSMSSESGNAVMPYNAHAPSANHNELFSSFPLTWHAVLLVINSSSGVGDHLHLLTFLILTERSFKRPYHQAEPRCADQNSLTTSFEN